MYVSELIKELKKLAKQDPLAEVYVANKTESPDFYVGIESVIFQTDETEQDINYVILQHDCDLIEREDTEDEYLQHLAYQEAMAEMYDND